MVAGATGAVSLTNAYDLVPYTDHAYAESHPDRLAVVGRLNRFEAPDVARARVLEIACGRGGNLLPMAAGLPDATFVGVDRSRKQIDEAISIAEHAGLRNVAFRVEDFERIDGAAPYDYVIAHGLCSWIANDARRALFRTIARVLAPRGIAYVSFNVLPGWYDRLAARDWLKTFATPERARASLEELQALVSPELASYRASIERVVARIAETDDAYVRHEYFAPEHHPQLVSHFLDETEAGGLGYLGDAIPQQTALELAPSALAARATAMGARDAQQLLDFARATAFRRALLVRADTDFRWSPKLDVNALATMSVTSRLRPTAVDGELTAGNLTVQVGEHGRDALREIALVAPRAAPIDFAWREELFDLWLATNALDLHVHSARMGDGSSDHPCACPVARWHATHGGAITNRWHQEVTLEDDITRWVLARLDGTRTIDDLVRELVSRPGDAEPKTLVRTVIAQLASLALLV